MDEDVLVRRSAAWALGKLNDTRAVEPPIEALGGGRDDPREDSRAVLGPGRG